MNKDDLGKERDASRKVMLDAWQKHLKKESLEPLEQQIVSLIQAHPEFQPAFEQDEHLAIDYPMDPTINPYLHIGLHLTILEQISLDRPVGIRDIYQQLTKQIGNTHEAEHLMMQVLTNAIDAAIQDPNGNAEQVYLQNLKRLLSDH